MPDTVWVVCPECGGRGTRVSPGCSVWTREDREEDPEGFEGMMEGRYDETCPFCKGRTTVEESRLAEVAELAREERRALQIQDGTYRGADY